MKPITMESGQLWFHPRFVDCLKGATIVTTTDSETKGRWHRMDDKESRLSSIQNVLVNEDPNLATC